MESIEEEWGIQREKKDENDRYVMNNEGEGEGEGEREREREDQRIFIGGEEEGLKKVDTFIFKEKGLTTYLLNKNNLSCKNISSLTSPYLSSGCLSPKKLF